MLKRPYGLVPPTYLQSQEQHRKTKTEDVDKNTSFNDLAYKGYQKVMDKKKFAETKVGKFLKEKAPAVLNSIGDILPDQGTFGLVKNIITSDFKFFIIVLLISSVSQGGDLIISFFKRQSK